MRDSAAGTRADARAGADAAQGEQDDRGGAGADAHVAPVKAVVGAADDGRSRRVGLGPALGGRCGRAGPFGSAPRDARCGSADGLEVVLCEPVGHLVAEHGALYVGGSEVDGAPHARVDDLLERLREPVEAAGGAGAVAEGAKGDLVVPKNACRECTMAPLMQPCPAGWSGKPGVTSGVPNCWVAGSNSGVHAGSASVAGSAVAVGPADRGDRPPELPVVLAVPAADRAVG